MEPPPGSGEISGHLHKFAMFSLSVSDNMVKVYVE